MFSLHFSFDFPSKYLSFLLYLKFSVSQEVTNWFLGRFSRCIRFHTSYFIQKVKSILFSTRIYLFFYIIHAMLFSEKTCKMYFHIITIVALST